MKGHSRILLFFVTLFFSTQAFSQDEVNFTVLNDEPEKIKKLFIGFQPFYGELWATNPTAGFGVDASYHHDTKATFRFHAHRAYGASFDLMKQGAKVNSSMENETSTLFNIEFGGAYHIKDVVEESKTNMVLYRGNTKRNKWSAQVPPTVTIPSKMRVIIGGRVGGMYYQSSFDGNRMIERQGVDYADILSDEGSPIPTEYLNELGDPEQVNIFSNLSVFGMYLGASHTWIRNISVEFTDGFEPNIEDLIFTTYFDLLIGLSVKKDNVFYQQVEYKLNPLKTLPLGARIGIEGKRNRDLGMAFGAEIGYRPGLKKGGFFGMAKIIIPMITTNLDENQVNAYEAN